jgi:NADH dehydrogenase
MKLVTVFGGSGFVGRHLVRHLASRGWRVRVAVRDIQRASFLKPAGDLGQISLIPATISDPAGVAAAVTGADAVVNLVGVLYERGARSFANVHATGAGNVAQAAAKAGVRSLVQVSALGADAHANSKYARSKAAGEAAVRAAFPGASIIRPSVVFGPEDGFFNLFGTIAMISPAVPFFTDTVPHAAGGGGPRFQPVYVGDVVEAITACLEDAVHAGKTYELAGPRIYDMREIMNIVNRETQRRRWVAGFPFFVAHIGAFFLQFLPKPLLTPDQVRQLKAGNVATGRMPGLAAFGIAPTTAEVVVPTYLKRFRPVQQNKRLRLQPRT